MSAAPNRYDVQVERAGEGWDVHIVGLGGAPVSTRACADEDEARLYASTVRQHLRWLSEERFRRYYRLPAEAR